jgi:MFS family permease
MLTRDIAWLGSASVGVTSDRMGRRKAIAFGCAWGVLGGALMAGAAHVAMRECFWTFSWLTVRFVLGN